MALCPLICLSVLITSKTSELSCINFVLEGNGHRVIWNVAQSNRNSNLFQFYFD